MSPRAFESPRPSWPKPLPPQHFTVSSSSTAHACSLPRPACSLPRPSTLAERPTSRERRCSGAELTKTIVARVSALFGAHGVELVLLAGVAAGRAALVAAADILVAAACAVPATPRHGRAHGGEHNPRALGRSRSSLRGPEADPRGGSAAGTITPGDSAIEALAGDVAARLIEAGAEGVDAHLVADAVAGLHGVAGGRQGLADDAGFGAEGDVLHAHSACARGNTSGPRARGHGLALARIDRPRRLVDAASRMEVGMRRPTMWAVIGWGMLAGCGSTWVRPSPSRSWGSFIPGSFPPSASVFASL